jgi:formylglycine-generating enzyme required for sulfatase activity
MVLRKVFIMRMSASLVIVVLALSVGVASLVLGPHRSRHDPAPPPDHAPPPEGVTDPAGVRLVPIPAGEFWMGGEKPPARQLEAFPFALYGKKASYFSDEYPRHRVRITRPFYLGECEVTVGQFRRFVGETGYQTEAEKDGTGGWGYNPGTRKMEGRRPGYTWRGAGFEQTDQHPVVNVSYHDALAFCAWLSKKAGRVYRLPSEAEWEYACRAGTETRYHNGDDPRMVREVAHCLDETRMQKYGHVHEIEFPPGGPFTAPVGGLRPNAWGLYDMHGNAWEWCGDYYDEEYYARSPSADPRGPAETNVRVRRGGGWNSFPLYARASFRNYNSGDSRCVNLGFRVLREMAR